MTSPPNITNITPPRVPFIDDRTGLISREWYRFLLNLFTLTGGGTTDLTVLDLMQSPTDPSLSDSLIPEIQDAKLSSLSARYDQLYQMVDDYGVAPIIKDTKVLEDRISALEMQPSGTVDTNGFVPYVGATKDVDLGPNKLSVQGDTILGVSGTEGNSIKVNGLNFTSRLKVSDLDGTNAAQTILHKHSTTVEPLIVAARSNSDTAAHGDVVAGQVMFSQYGTGWTASSYKIFASTYISADTTGTVGAASSPGRYTIAVTPDGAIWPVDAWWITQDGKIHATAAYASPTLDAAVAKGTWTASGTWTLPAHTLGGTVSGGGNQINNVVIGTTTPLAGTFTTVDAQTLLKGKGTATNDSAAAGYIGEFTDYAANTSIATTATNGTSVSLTAGDWDVFGTMVYNASATANVYMQIGISQTSATFTGTQGKDYSFGFFTGAIGLGMGYIGRVRISLASTTTVYLVGLLGTEAKTCSCYLSARRVR